MSQVHSRILTKLFHLKKKVNWICAPGPEDKSTWALILWTKDNPDDNEPHSDKIVSLVSNLFDIVIIFLFSLVIVSMALKDYARNSHKIMNMLMLKFIPLKSLSMFI